MDHSKLSFSKEVQEALRSGMPVVALESTIIAHGMPYPQNLETAFSVEHAVRKNGAVPATIAVLEGRMQVGCSSEQLEELSVSGKVMKLSRWNLPLALVSKKTGATTVAATMIIADLAGIRIFASGGIGGVHRMVEKSMDISADLTELAQTNVAVVASGVKAILDIPKTIEILETLGVPIITFGSDEFPAFYSRSSGIKAALRMNSASEIAGFLRAKWDIPLKGGVLIANPVPAVFNFPGKEMEKIIKQALAEAKNADVYGKDITPFLLSKIADITEGKSLDTNIALVKNNAALAASIAVNLRSEKTE
ncbi:MAG: pseudouridine-5'-phosphate glycosidase [Crocinitomicaceae bacterium]|nr:pseudouridine-5'-phosphate glycosidase [Crocinitomicaceae bacterium]